MHAVQAVPAHPGEVRMTPEEYERIEQAMLDIQRTRDLGDWLDRWDQWHRRKIVLDIEHDLDAECTCEDCIAAEEIRKRYA